MNRVSRAIEALGISRPKNVRIALAKITAVLVAFVGIGLNVGSASAATLSSATVALSDPRPSQASVNYTFTGSTVTSALIKCVKVVVSTTSTGDTAPTSFSGASATVTAASSTLINSSASGWTLAKSDGTSSSGQNNIFQYTNTTGVTPTTLTGATFILGGVTNSNTADTAYYYKLSTYNSTGCSTGPVDNAAVEFINTNGSTLSLTVDNTLSFTVNSVGSSASCDGTTTTQASTATTIPFGTVTSAANGVVCQDLSAATNATNGYTIFARYTGAPSNALSQPLQDVSGTNAAPAAFPAAGVTEAYGMSTNDATLAGTNPTANRFTSPSQGWAKLTTSNAEVAYEAAGVTTQTYRIGHQVAITNTTKPGTYTTTVIYTCTPVY